MIPDAHTLARICIAMREGQEIEIRCNNVIIQTGRAGGPWVVPMIVRTVVDRDAWTESQWHRSVEEMLEKLEEL